MRVLWLLMGVGIAIQAFAEKNYLMLLPGLYFVFAALANVGCFAGNCATGFNAAERNKKENLTDKEYEEMHSKK